MIPFLFLNNFCYGFVHSGDTIMLCNNKCVLNLPKEKTYNIQYYEEGEFHNYYLINDSVQITVHCGYLVNLPLNITAVRYIVSSKKKSNESFLILVNFFIKFNEKINVLLSDFGEYPVLL